MKNDIKSQFIVSDSSTPDQASAWAEKAIKYGRISKNGGIILDKEGLSPDDKIKISLILRFIAGSLDETISKSVAPKELTPVTGERNESVGSRLSVLSKTGFCKTEGYGKYIVHHYKITSFLDELDRRKESSPNSQKPRTARRGSVSRKEKALTGVGLYIQEIVDENFFNQPRFLSEVEQKLIAENHHYDSRVIDSAIRTIFLLKRKILRRIENKDGGKAKWKYVNR